MTHLMHPNHYTIFPLSAILTSTVLGLISGGSFIWSPPERAWDHLIAAFLWVLMVTTGTGLARSFLTRLGRNEWRRGWRLGFEIAFPATTCFLLALALVSAQGGATAMMESGVIVNGRPNVLSLAPLFYGMAVLPMLLTGPGFVLTSPYRVRAEPTP